MVLSYEEVDNVIRKIALGKDLICLGNEFFYIHYPTNFLKAKAKLLRDNAYKNALNEGLLPKKDLEDLILTRGIFSKDDENAVSKLQSKLEAQEILLSKTTKVRANQERIKKTITELKNDLSKILVKKYSKLYMSADNKAEEEMYSFLCSECVFKEDNTKYWGDFNSFLEDRNNDVKNSIFSSFMSFMHGIETGIIRYVARSNLWRIRYTSSLKISEPLFGVALVDYTTDQLNLLYWSNFYEQVYSMLSSDRPSEAVIEDDEVLDKFMEEYYKDMNNESTIRRDQKNKNKGKGSLSAFDSEEVIITQFNELYHDIKYDKPREAQKIKDRADIKKRTSGG
jgi:hypothetical protein